jgi:hypothetical protein
MNVWFELERIFFALSTLRVDHDDVLSCADAICIDQGHISERNSQVRMMKSTYEYATQIVVWLGPSRKRSELALELTRDLSLHGGLTSGSKNSFEVRTCRSVCRL